MIMRILFFNYEFPPSGSETEVILYCLLREYSNNPELQIDLVTSSIDEKQHLFKFGDNISIHRLSIGKNPDNINHQSLSTMLRYAWKAYKFSRELIKENAYDFTQSFSVFPCGMVSLRLKRKLYLPYMISLRESDISGYNHGFFKSYIKSKIKKIWENAYFIIASSQKLAQLAMDSQPGKEVEVIYKGVDMQDFFPDAAKINPDYFTIVCVSNIIPQKGVRFLIQAFNIISVRYSQARLIIVGDGNERISLQQLVQGLGMKDKVFFAGSVPHENVPEYCQKSDVFVLSSLEDKISNAMLEALACGLPIIATDTKMTREILADNENCLIVKMKDPDDLAEKIEKLILNRNLGREMGRKNRVLAERFSWEAIANEYFNTYLKVKKY